MTKKKQVIYFDREKNKFVGITKAFLKEMTNSFPDIDVKIELLKMESWLMTPKGEKRKGDIRFVTGWLSRARPNKGQNHAVDELVLKESPLKKHFESYLKELWKNKEHLLNFNTFPR